VIRSSLKDLKKAITQVYKSPFKVSTYKDEVEGEMQTFLNIESLNKKTLADFQYIKEDGAIISGYNDSHDYRKEREEYFPEYYDETHLNIYQKAFNLFYSNTVVKEFVKPNTLAAINKNMFDISDDYRRGVPLIDIFSFLGNSGRSDTAIGLQYYLNEKNEIKPRMKIQFSFTSCSHLIIYYDYDSNCFRFGDVQLIDGDKTSILDDNTISELFNLNADELLDDDNKLNSLFTNWTLFMGSYLNKQAFIHYNLDELIDASNKNKTLEHLKLIKMAFI
jgi:hypothetical protein